jgi:hypothetical protein
LRFKCFLGSISEYIHELLSITMIECHIDGKVGTRIENYKHIADVSHPIEQQWFGCPLFDNVDDQCLIRNVCNYANYIRLPVCYMLET